MEKSSEAVSAHGDGRSGCGVSIALANRIFEISETCYRYERTLSDENAEIADWLVRLTANRRSWGFGLCFLYLRNVKGFKWSHKRVYRIYCALELNLRIVRNLNQIIEWLGSHDIIRVDNGPEYVSGLLMEWAEKRGIRIGYIQPGKPQQNAYIERYNRTVRREWLDQYILETIEKAQDQAKKWLWTSVVAARDARSFFPLNK